MARTAFLLDCTHLIRNIILEELRIKGFAVVIEVVIDYPCIPVV